MRVTVTQEAYDGAGQREGTFSGEVVHWGEADAVVKCDDGVFRFAEIADLRAEKAVRGEAPKGSDVALTLLRECKCMMDDLEHESVKHPARYAFYHVDVAPLHKQVVDYFS